MTSAPSPPGLLGQDLYVVAGDNRSTTIIALVKRHRIVGRVLRQPPAAQFAVVK